VREREVTGVKLVWASDASPPASVVVRYQYLGWPMKLVINNEQGIWTAF
jgi:hypothetical protein